MNASLVKHPSSGIFLQPGFAFSRIFSSAGIFLPEFFQTDFFCRNFFSRNFSAGILFSRNFW
jgi:hypothetical protein